MSPLVLSPAWVRLAIPCLLGLALATAACAPTPSPEGPVWSTDLNILWLVAEDLGPYIPAFGDSTVATPNLSRLAKEGVRYPNVFSPSGVCAPSRASIATGMYPTRIGAMHMRTGPWYQRDPTPEALATYASGLPDGVLPYEAVPPPNARMHSEYLRQLGYYATNRAKNDYQFRAPLTAWDENGPQASWQSREGGQPFFSIVNFSSTHESQIWARAADSLWVDADLDVPVPPYLPETDSSLQDIRRMYSNVVRMDQQVGEVLQMLEEDGLLENTVIFWYADHGGPLPRQKRAAYDSGLNAPMMIRFPNAWRAGEVDDRLVSFVDFLPTLVAMTGTPPPNVDGRAFEGPFESTPRDFIHAAVDRLDERPNGIRAVRDQRFKYLRHLDPSLGMFVPVNYREQMPIMRELHRLRLEGRLTPAQEQWFRDERPKEELFDLSQDPHEIHDLAQNFLYQDKLAELRAEADAWMADTQDRGAIPEREYLKSIWPEGVQPSTSAPTASMNQDGSISLESNTEGGLIGYQILAAGDLPEAAWDIYNLPLTLGDGEELLAIAHRIGYLQSDTLRFAPGADRQRLRD